MEAATLNMNTCLLLIYSLVSCESYETEVADVGMNACTLSHHAQSSSSK